MMNAEKTKKLADKCLSLISKAEKDGVVIDDGNVVDLIADNTPESLYNIRRALVVAGLRERFPNATSIISAKDIYPGQLDKGAEHDAG